MLLAGVAADGGRVDAQPAQLVVEQHPGAGAALAVDVAQAGTGEVGDAGQPQRVAGGDQKTLVAVHQPDHGQLGIRAEDPVQVRKRVLAGSRVEQMRAGQVAQPVAQRDQPAQRPHVRRRQGEERVGSAQCRGRHVQHQVVRADRDDRALDVGQPAQQLHPDPLAGMVTLHPGRHHQEAVRADQRGQHAGRARQGCRHDVAADAAQPDPDPVVGADGRGQLAGQPGGGRRPFPRGRTLERGQHRRGEDVEGQRGRDRVAGSAQYRSSGHRGGRIAGDDAQHDRVPGTHGDAVHGQRAGGRDHARGVVVASGARPGDEDHQVGVDGGLPDRGGDQLGVVGDDARSCGSRSRSRRPARPASSSWCRRSRRGAARCRPGGSRRRSG